MKNALLALVLALPLPLMGQYGFGAPNRQMTTLGWGTTARGIIHYASGKPNTAITWRAVKDTAAYCWVDTLTSTMYNWNHAGNFWATFGVIASATPPAATISNGAAVIDNRDAIWRNTTTGVWAYYDRIGGSWAAFGAAD